MNRDIEAPKDPGVWNQQNNEPDHEGLCEENVNNYIKNNIICLKFVQSDHRNSFRRHQIHLKNGATSTEPLTQKFA